MKYINDYTGEVFDTEKECLEAEKEFINAKKAQEEKQKEVDELYDKAVKAFCDYIYKAYDFDELEKVLEEAKPQAQHVVVKVDGDDDKSFEEFLKEFFN